ncbi:acetoacetate decarboxylase family protein [Arcicella aquatica]|uniref:Acetoacetate decarboxylase family protein n=1 Tax=Arcicella aquatica TaxID=217141 RepID=A0ABU5QUE4_9BACT|nr:acetoacetate decarboxylase family protein [Arcicella aquatica]MEA5260429.1 acetoacetate decarboxylase family protein [Arcicella aquatica]
MKNDSEIRLEPAPWNLTGNAYALIYKFPKEFVVENGFMEDFQKKRFLGYFGTVMLVDYQSSNVGKYYELLFIPGMFTFDWAKVFSISKIYVSSEESVLNGHNNWGIPKEKADFEWVEDKGGLKKVQVSINKHVIFEAELSKGFLSVPLKSNFFPLKLAQKLNNDLMLTTFNFKGKVKFLKIGKIKVDKGYFPDITRLSPLLTIQINNFDMRFEIPLIRKNYFN